MGRPLWLLRTMRDAQASGVLFRPRLAVGASMGVVPTLYDLERLPELSDFDRLNDGETKFGVAATDVVSGERVVFDTARGARIGPDHLAASCALLPVFSPAEIEGRLLGDGGLAANAPLDLALEDPEAGDLLRFVIELFALEGRRPRTLAASVARGGPGLRRPDPPDPEKARAQASPARARPAPRRAIGVGAVRRP